MGLLDRFLEKQLQASTNKITETVTQSVIKHVDTSLEKASPSVYDSYAIKPGLKRYSFTSDVVNGNIQNRKKPGSNISFETLRRFSVSHEVTRACINLRKRQITGLEWDIVTENPNDTNSYKTQAQEIKNWFKLIGGRGNNYRRFMDKFIEDLMVLDAVAIEKQVTRGSKLANLIPIDATTIKLRVDETGATPEPPEPAYVQVIKGAVTAEMTADEMIYEMMNPRNDSPYGLAPLESLMIIVTSSLKAGMYNLAYLTDGNVPEGFYNMPETWQPQQIKDFQEYFDALMAGDETMSRRLKFMPNGTYMPTKKPEDMAFQEFNDWLTKITCALFEIQPQEIGFTPKTGLGGKGFAEEQNNVSERKGIAPLANFIEEIFTKVIQEDLGYTELKFQYTGLIEHDEKGVAELNEVLIRSGQRTINELRTDEGLTPIDGLDKPFVLGNVTFIDQESQDAKQVTADTLQSQLSGAPTEDEQVSGGSDTKPEAEEKAGATEKVDGGDTNNRHVELVTELRTFRKYAIGRVKANKAVRPFESNILPEDVVDELNSRIEKADNVESVRGIFREYMEDYQVNFLSDVVQLQKGLEKVLK